MVQSIPGIYLSERGDAHELHFCTPLMKEGIQKGDLKEQVSLARIQLENNTSRRNFLKTTVASAAVAQAPSLARAANRRPNIVLIMADDVSPDYYSCYGSTVTNTPNIDAIADAGVMFRTCWASALCSPARACITTGRYAHRTGFYSNGLSRPQTDGSNDLLRHHHSFAWFLKQAGYATAIAGKWHLGSGAPYGKVGGFDEYCLWEGLREIEHLPGSPTFTGQFEDDTKQTTSRYWHPAVVQNDKLLDTKENDFGPDIYTDFICDFMERNRDKPFLAYYPMAAPHGSRKGHTTTPLRGKPGDMSKASAKEEEQKFAALNEYIDVLVGRIHNKVKDLGLADNTIIMFCSDNGTAVTAKSRGVERGCRVPFVVAGAGIKRRGVTDEITDFADFLPTLAELAGVKIPADYEVDGTSLTGFLRGETDRHRDWILSYIGGTRLVRTKRHLLEAVNPILDMPEGRLYDCGNNRDGKGYRLIIDRDSIPKVQRMVDDILAKHPSLQEDESWLQNPAGQRFLKECKSKAFREKHLNNHPDYEYTLK